MKSQQYPYEVHVLRKKSQPYSGKDSGVTHLPTYPVMTGRFMENLKQETLLLYILYIYNIYNNKNINYSIFHLFGFSKKFPPAILTHPC